MKSMNNWLTFSLQSPHLTLDAVKQQSDPVSHQAAVRTTVNPVVANSLILSNMSQNHNNNLGGYQSSANDCYNSLRSSGDGGNSNSGQTGLEMIRSDGSLCIMEALSRSHSADQHWPQQRAMQSDGGVQQQQHTLLTADQLSRLTGNAGDSNNQQLTSSHSHYEMQSSTATETRDGPKLEDFLGGASLGGQYSEREAAQQQAQLDSLYYNPTGKTPNYAPHQRSDASGSRINVNLPYSSNAGGGSLHGVPPSYHVAYGGGVPTESSSLTHPYDHPHSRELQETSNLGSRMHAQNLLQAALDQSTTVELLSERALQLPQGSPSTAGDEYGLKTWLRHQAAAEKAGQQQQRGLNALATLQPLTLSMSAGSHQSSVSTPVHGGSAQLVAGESPTGLEPRKRGAGRAGSKEPSPRKSIDTFGQRTSVYRGVTRHRWTGRYEAHLWDNSCRKEGQTRKGRQVYLGGYDKEEKAARAYDLAALKYWGASTTINFPLTTYETEVEEMKNMSRQEYVASLRRKSSGFSRGASMYRGVTRHHQHGRWQARIGRVAGNKDLYLGTYSTQEEAAEAYDIAAIKFRGINAVTNFDISRYDAARIQQASVNGHHGQEAMKAAKEAELAAAMSISTASAHAAQSRAHTAAHALSHGQGVFGDHPDDHQTASTQGTPGSQLTSEGGLTTQQQQGQGAGLSKNLHEWQMLYQQQARTTWTQDDTRHLGVGFPESMRAPTSNKFQQPPTNGMLLRNLMGLEALPPQEHHPRADQGSCSANQQQALMGGQQQQQQGMPGSTGSMISTSGYQGGAYNPGQQQQGQQGQQQGQGSVDRGAVVDSPKNSVGESEEASSKSSGYDPVGVLYMSPGSTQGKMGGYETNTLTPWISSNPATVQGLAGRSNLSMGGHMGSGPIFAHSWNE